MMDVDITVDGKHIKLTFRTSTIDIAKAKIIEIVVANIPVSDSSVSLDFKSVKSIDLNGFKYLQSIIKNLDELKIINLQEKYKKLVS